MSSLLPSSGSSGGGSGGRSDSAGSLLSVCALLLEMLLSAAACRSLLLSPAVLAAACVDGGGSSAASSSAAGVAASTLAPSVDSLLRIQYMMLGVHNVVSIAMAARALFGSPDVRASVQSILLLKHVLLCMLDFSLARHGFGSVTGNTAVHVFLAAALAATYFVWPPFDQQVRVAKGR